MLRVLSQCTRCTHPLQSPRKLNAQAGKRFFSHKLFTTNTNNATFKLSSRATQSSRATHPSPSTLSKSTKRPFLFSTMSAALFVAAGGATASLSSSEYLAMPPRHTEETHNNNTTKNSKDLKASDEADNIAPTTTPSSAVAVANTNSLARTSHPFFLLLRAAHLLLLFVPPLLLLPISHYLLPSLTHRLNISSSWSEFFSDQVETWLVWSMSSGGPTFLKLGQWLSTRPDLLPRRLCLKVRFTCLLIFIIKFFLCCHELTSFSFFQKQKKKQLLLFGWIAQHIYLFLHGIHSFLSSIVVFLFNLLQLRTKRSSLRQQKKIMRIA